MQCACSYSVIYHWGDQSTRTSRWILFACLFCVKLVLSLLSDSPIVVVFGDIGFIWKCDSSRITPSGGIKSGGVWKSSEKL